MVNRAVSPFSAWKKAAPFTSAVFAFPEFASSLSQRGQDAVPSNTMGNSKHTVQHKIPVRSRLRVLLRVGEERGKWWEGV